MKVSQLLEDVDIYNDHRPTKIPEKLLKLIDIYCRNNFFKIVNGQAPILFRGSNMHLKVLGGVGYELNNKRTEPRQSITRSNIWNIFTSHDKQWEGYPPRELSYFCAITSGVAKKFSMRHIPGMFQPSSRIVIPFDDVKNFAVSKLDFNYLTIKRIDMFDRGNDISNLARDADYMASLEEEVDAPEIYSKLRALCNVKPLTSALKLKTLTDIKNFSDALNDLYKFICSKEFKKIYKGTLKDYVETFIAEYKVFNFDLYRWLEMNVNPTNLGIQKFSSFSDIKVESLDSEIWFDGGYIGLCFDDVENKEITPNFLKGLL